MMMASGKPVEDRSPNGNQIMDDGQSVQDQAGRRTRIRQQPQRALSPGVQRSAEESLPELNYEGEPLKLSRFLQNGVRRPVLVHIAAAYMSGQNPKVRARQLWGNIVYTQDSDLVAVLMHNGFYSHSLQQPPASMAEVRAVVQPLPPQPAYASSARNSIRSRAWGTAVEGFSYRARTRSPGAARQDCGVGAQKSSRARQVERCYLVSKSGAVTPLEPGPDGAATVVPTFTPAHFERTLNTRAATSSVERRQRTMNEVTVQYNLCNEPRIKYSMAAVADRGLKPSQWTSSRLRSEVLVLETHRTRYELSRNAPPPDAPEELLTETYRWARCKEAAPLPRLQRVGLPLPEALLDVMEPALAWEELQWSQSGVFVRGELYPVVRLHFAKRQPPLGETVPYIESGPVAMEA